MKDEVAKILAASAHIDPSRIHGSAANIDQMVAPGARPLFRKEEYLENAEPTGEMCQFCGTELVYPFAEVRFQSGGSMRQIVCVGCGFSATR